MESKMQRFEVMDIGKEPKPVEITIQQKIFFYCLCVAVGLFSFLFARETVKHSSTLGRWSSLVSTPEIVFYNEYTKDHPYTDRYDWKYIVEPYKMTYFELSGVTYDDSYEFIWYLDGWRVASGEKINITFTSPTQQFQRVLVNMIDKSSGKVVATSFMDVMCKYVRREIRRLFEQDRIAFFQAVNIIFRVPTQTGKVLYGNDYRSKDFFTRLHLYYGGTQTCDRWHEGPGFVVTHFALSNLFEKTLQAINPALSLPYWDFTLESTFYDPTTFRSSQVFFDDWFGDSAPTNRYHTVSEGRWAYVSSMRNAINYSSVISTYGMLRSPWNTDIAPYVIRSADIYGKASNLKPSGCEEYATGLAYRTWTDVAWNLNTYIHGHIHELIGGSYGSIHTFNIPDKSENEAGNVNGFLFAHSTEAYSKILWRYDYLVCPPGNTATFETYMEELKEDGVHRACGCPVLRNNTYSENAQILFDIGILAQMVYTDINGNAINSFVDEKGNPYTTVLPPFTAAQTEQIYDEIINVLCDIGFLGDMFQATSTNDITFWVLHPTMERLWHLIQLNIDQKKIVFDQTWDDTQITCPGHYSDSVTPFKNMWDTDNRPYTNADLYALLHPDFNPYIYEHFDWPHCEFLEYNMVGF